MTHSVSVIITCYNYAHYIGRAIESVLKQTYPIAEIVIVDDGSTDASPQVIERYVAAYPALIRSVRQPNQGPAKARQVAAEIASGQWVTPLDADDWLHPEAVECYARRSEACPEAVVVYGGWFATDEHGTILNEHLIHLHRPDEPLEGNILKTVYRGNVVAATALVRRQTLLDVGGYYSEDTSHTGRGHEDYFLYLKMLADGLSFAYVPRALFYYRGVSGSVSHQSDAFRLNQLAVLRSVYRRNFDRMIETAWEVSIDREARIERGYYELRGVAEKLTEMYELHARLVAEVASLLPRLGADIADMRSQLYQDATEDQIARLQPIDPEAMRQYMIITSSRSYQFLTRYVFPVLDSVRSLGRRHA